MTNDTTFEPGRYLSKVNGSDYLEVKWRLVWLREQHPEAVIETEMVSNVDHFAVFKARVMLPSGASATGWGSEAANDFRDYIEKAETKSIGRALAALGFGTQFCPDFDFGAAAGRIVDAPVDFASTRGRKMIARQQQLDDQNFAPAQPPPPAQPTGVNQPATERQRKFIEAIAREIGLTDEELAADAEQAAGRPMNELTRRDASAVIEHLQIRRAQSDQIAS